MRTVLPVIAVGVFFLASAYVAQVYEESLVAFIGTGVSGMLIYLFLAITGTAVAPLSSLPLIPLASALWGPITAALLSVVGWWIGGMIAFSLSRRFGRPLVEKMVSPDKIARVEQRVPTDRQYWAILFLSIALPTDVLSYTLGLFNTISMRTFAVAMFIGNIPFAFVFAYAGALPIVYQLLLIPVAVLLTLLVLRRPPAKH